MKKAEMKKIIISQTIEAKKEMGLYLNLNNAELYNMALTKWAVLYGLCEDLEIANDYIEELFELN